MIDNSQQGHHEINRQPLVHKGPACFWLHERLPQPSTRMEHACFWLIVVAAIILAFIIIL